MLLQVPEQKAGDNDPRPLAELLGFPSTGGGNLITLRGRNTPSGGERAESLRIFKNPFEGALRNSPVDSLRRPMIKEPDFPILNRGQLPRIAQPIGFNKTPPQLTPVGRMPARSMGPTSPTHLHYDIAIANLGPAFQEWMMGPEKLREWEELRASQHKKWQENRVAAGRPSEMSTTEEMYVRNGSLIGGGLFYLINGYWPGCDGR